jgi:uncharacterized protein (DUF2252 family)
VIELRLLDQTTRRRLAIRHTISCGWLSLEMAARSCDLPGVTTARMTEDLVVAKRMYTRDAAA